MIDGWQERLVTAIEAYQARSGTADYALSRDAGLGQNFVGQLKKGRAAPKLDALVKLTELIDASLMAVLFGSDISKEEERFLFLLRQIDDEEDRKAYLQILRGMSQTKEPQEPQPAGSETGSGKSQALR